MRVLCFTLLATVCLHFSPVMAQETATAPPQSVKPGINKSFLDPDLDVDQWIKRFEVESREVFRARDQIVKQLKLKPGDRIADVGTGTGLFVEPFSLAVGEKGWVFALDIVPKFVERVGKISDILDLKNVTPVLCGQDDVRLPPLKSTYILIDSLCGHTSPPLPGVCQFKVHTASLGPLPCAAYP